VMSPLMISMIAGMASPLKKDGVHRPCAGNVLPAWAVVNLLFTGTP
jgi:hypothetical protein